MNYGENNKALTDTTNTATGWILNVAKDATGDAGNSGSNASSFPAALSGIEPGVKEDNFFFNDGATLTVSFTGLDKSKTYDLLFYGSRGVTIQAEKLTGLPANAALIDSIRFSLACGSWRCSC